MGEMVTEACWAHLHAKIDNDCVNFNLTPTQAGVIWEAGKAQQAPRSELFKELGAALNPNSALDLVTVSPVDAKKAYNKLREKLEDFDTIVCALYDDDRSPPRGKRLFDRFAKFASICKEALDMIAVEVDEIE